MSKLYVGKWIMKNKKSYFIKIFSYFMIVLFIPILAIVVLNIQSQSILKKQILLSNQNTLEQAFSLLDNVVAEMNETCITISNLREVQQYILTTNNESEMLPYKRYEISQLLKTYQKEKFGDVFVYYPDSDYIISGVYGALSTDNYYKTYYGNKGVHSEEFYNNLKCNSGYPALNVMNAWEESTYLCVSMQCVMGEHLGNFVVSVVLDTGYLNMLLSGNYAGRGGTVLMFDRNEELILVGNKEKVAYDMKEYPGDSRPYETSFEREKYVMQIYKASDLKGYYAFAIPARFFWEQLLSMRLFSVIGILICVCLGMTLVFGTSKRAYAPLGKIVGNLKRTDVDYDPGSATEFEFLEEIFQNESEEKQRLYREVKESKAGKRERFLFRLLEGSAFEEGKRDDVFESNGISLCSDRFVVGMIQISKGYEMEEGLISFVIGNVFEEIFNRNDRGYILSLAENEHVFLLNLSIATQDVHIEAMIEEGKRFLETNSEFKMTIGYSKICEGMQEIQKAYEEARTALRYRYMLGQNAIISFASVEGREFSYLSAGQAMLPTMLENYLSETSRSRDVSKFVSEIFEVYGIDENISLETMECFKFDVINAINRVGLQCGCLLEERKKNIQELLKRESLKEFEEYIAYLLVHFRQKNTEQKNSNGICQLSRKYIEENYFNSQLSLSHLGEAVGMSTSHLSKLYKEKYGVSIAHDITFVRLRNAKKLLRDTENSINEIAEQTGFSNGNVFIKVFKKWEGITPGRYRELN